MNETGLVENAGALTSIFGAWPSFHDGEVLSIHLDRAGAGGPTLEADVHVFRMTNEVDACGYYMLTDHTRVTLRFTNIVLRNLRWFNEQNSLSYLLVEVADPAEGVDRRLSVRFGSNYGVEADLFCDEARVIAVEPYTPAI